MQVKSTVQSGEESPRLSAEDAIKISSSLWMR